VGRVRAELGNGLVWVFVCPTFEDTESGLFWGELVAGFTGRGLGRWFYG